MLLVYYCIPMAPIKIIIIIIIIIIIYWDAKPVNPTPAHVAKQWTPEDFTVYAAERVDLGTSATIR